MTRKGIMKAAHKLAKQAKNFNGGDYIVYLSFYMKKENWNMNIIKEEGQENESFTLNIPFKSKSARKEAKEMGARWNAENKTWELNCKKCQLEWADLDKFLAARKRKTIIEENYGTGCITTRTNAMRYGYDAIER